MTLAALVVLFVLGVRAVSRTADGQGRAALESDLRRAAVHCYAVEGRYPPDLPYLLEQYGVRYDKSRFLVFYTPVSSNLPPDVTVIEPEGGTDA